MLLLKNGHMIDPYHHMDQQADVLVTTASGATKEASTRSSVACADYFSGRTPKFIVPELRDLI